MERPHVVKLSPDAVSLLIAVATDRRYHRSMDRGKWIIEPMVPLLHSRDPRQWQNRKRPMPRAFRLTLTDAEWYNLQDMVATELMHVLGAEHSWISSKHVGWFGDIDPAKTEHHKDIKLLAQHLGLAFGRE
jgi:hypothetical protein